MRLIGVHGNACQGFGVLRTPYSDRKKQEHSLIFRSVILEQHTDTLAVVHPSNRFRKDLSDL